MKIGLLAVDGHPGFPNLALMKAAAYHQQQGDTVEWFSPLFTDYDVVYMSKVFTHTPDYSYPIGARKVLRGGTGYSLSVRLPDAIDRLQPNYSIYPYIDDRTAYGFLTRGCPNHCKWCVVPTKEGNIHPYMDIEDIAIDGRTNVILMDNNILASDYGLQQIEKIAKLRLRVDFNQGLDARLVTTDVAQLLARVRWIRRIRFGCDTPRQVRECDRAVSLIRKAGYHGEFFFYCILTDDFRESFRRVNHWKSIGDIKCYPHAQPYLDFSAQRQVIPQWQRDLAQWANKKQLYWTTSFADFEPRRGFRCSHWIQTYDKI